MKRTSKRVITVILIIFAAILVGVAINLVRGIMEKSTHPDDYYDYIEKYSKEYDVPEEVICAVIKTESDFDCFAESSVGARGLMQMMPKTFEWLTGDEHLGEGLPFDMVFDPEVSIRYGAYYLRYLYNKFGNWDTVLAAYNGGEGNVAKWLKDPQYSSDGVTLKDIPFEETKNYVIKVNNEITTYKNLYKDKSEVK